MKIGNIGGVVGMIYVYGELESSLLNFVTVIVVGEFVKSHFGSELNVRVSDYVSNECVTIQSLFLLCGFGPLFWTTIYSLSLSSLSLKTSVFGF